MNNIVFPKRYPLIKVTQNIGDFYAASIPASLICEMAFSIKAIYSEGSLTGTQRKIKEDRTTLISEYIAGSSSTFPNSVILGANCNENGDYIDDESRRWRVEVNINSDGNERYSLVIPSGDKVVAIIDGQHRIEGLKKYFLNSTDPEDMDVLCSVFFDIPSSVQAEIFATINYNQKPVDKSLAYQLFGYSLDTKSNTEWAPDLLALHMVRIFDTDQESPFFGIITSGADENRDRKSTVGFTLSTAAVVEGIVKLFSSNPVKDRYRINKKSLFAGGRERLKGVRSSAPLRELYLNNEDRKIYDIISNYFVVAMELIVCPSKGTSKIRSTIGVLALFDVLKHILQCQDSLLASKEYFLSVLLPSQTIDFSHDFFSAAGIGRGRIKNTLILYLDIHAEHHVKVINRMKPELKEAVKTLI